MNKSFLSFFLPLMLGASAIPAYAGQNNTLRAPEKGVLCDRYVCANDKGLSRELTQKYLGEKAAIRVFSQGDFIMTEFTFANGIFCDVNEKLCREDRYYGTDGKRSGAISEKYTALLFGESAVPVKKSPQ